MKAVLLFLISVSFLLLRGDSFAYAHAHHNPLCYSPAQHSDKQQQLKVGGTNQESAIITSTKSNPEKNYLISIDDEDENTVFARKYVLPAKYFVILAYILLFGYLYSLLKKCLPFCRHLFHTVSNKYLVQRTLRI